MLFNSFEFLLFLPIVFFLHWFIFSKTSRSQNLIILVSSYFFYGWWSVKFLGLLALSTLLDYLYGFGVASLNKRKAKIFLWLSIINNIGILVFFKYYNFFAQQFESCFNMIGIHINPVFLNIVLPIGISFYTFHGMSYVFDIYRGKQRPINNFIDYAVFTSFFPLLVAGPIERANHLLPQLQKRRIFNYTQAVEGCRLILWGMFKKIVIADNLATIVDQTFNNYEHKNAYSLILGAISFSFQIYGDFSGYTDIALGCAKLFGVELLSNFRFPYFSRDIADFWRRWHISLSSWFRDYLYFPLGGSKQGKLKAVRNTFIIFLISGFWHGASWSFIVWGGLHACAFLPLLLLDKNRINVNNIVAQDKKLPNFHELTQIVTTFVFVTFAWIFFRADSVNRKEGLNIAVKYIMKIFTSTFQNPKQYFNIPTELIAFAYIIPLLIIDWYLRHDERKLKVFKNIYLRYIVYIIMVVLIVQFWMFKDDTNSFIYFQF